MLRWRQIGNSDVSFSPNCCLVYSNSSLAFLLPLPIPSARYEGKWANWLLTRDNCQICLFPIRKTLYIYFSKPLRKHLDVITFSMWNVRLFTCNTWAFANSLAGILIMGRGAVYPVWCYTEPEICSGNTGSGLPERETPVALKSQTSPLYQRS